MHIDIYMLFDRNGLYDRVNDDQWRAELADSRGLDDPADLSDEAVYGQAEFEIQTEFEEEVATIGRRFDDRCAELHPEWEGRYQLMVRGSVQRWDGTTSGHHYYSGRWESAPTEANPYRQVRTPPFKSLVTDTWRKPSQDADDQFGLFTDCEIEQIWEDREGTIKVRGVHHDGEVNVEVRAVAPDTEERENDRYLAWYVEDYDQDAHRSFLEKAWSDGVTANMAGYYGYLWPSLDETSAIAEVCQVLNMEQPVEVAGYRIDGCGCARLDDPDGETYSLGLVADEGGKTFAYYCSEYADETSGVLLFEVGCDGPCRLCSDNWLASDDYVKTCDRIAAGELAPVFVGENARSLVEDERVERASRHGKDTPASLAASAKACASAAGARVDAAQRVKL